MNRTLTRAAVVAAALALAACGDKGGANGGAASDTTQPAGSQPAPTAQAQAAPQTGTNTPQAVQTDPPIEGRDTVRHIGPGQTYASCMAQAKNGRPDERPLLERTCMNLPDAPKK